MDIEQIDWAAIMREMFKKHKPDEVDLAIETAIGENKFVMVYPDLVQ